jgi:hypothetical protein
VAFLVSATEIVWALGFGDSLVGRSHEFDFLASVRSLQPLRRVVRRHGLDADRPEIVSPLPPHAAKAKLTEQA